MTTYGRSARLLRRYGPWILVATTVMVAVTYGLHRIHLLPGGPAPRSLAVDLAAGAAAGLLLGAGTALLRAGTRGRIRSREDFARLTGRPVLATVPRHPDAGGTVRDPASPAAESYRYLRSRLRPSLKPAGTTTILVTSPGDRQGRTTTAANLAVTLAQAGRSVVLVDADLRHPRMHHVFQVPGDRGLTALLDGDADVAELLAETQVPGLRVMPAGHRDGYHIELFDDGRLTPVMRALEKHADVVILDSAAVLSASDAIVLASLCDRVLLVGDFARTGREAVRRALAELADVPAGNLVPVLVNVPKSAGALVPHPRVLPARAPEQPARGRLYSDADDVAPPGVTTHTYVDDEDQQSADDARAATVAVPVISGPAPAAAEGSEKAEG